MSYEINSIISRLYVIEVTLDRLDMITLYVDMVGARAEYNRGSMEMFIPASGQIYHYPNGFMLMVVI